MDHIAMLTPHEQLVETALHIGRHGVIVIVNRNRLQFFE